MTMTSVQDFVEFAMEIEVLGKSSPVVIRAHVPQGLTWAAVMGNRLL
jgi:hypothetical protein